MKRIIAFLMAAAIALSLFAVTAAGVEKPSDIVSETYCVMNAETGQLLVAGDPDKRMEPASITKILTCALALEYLDPDAEYTFSREAASYDQGSTHLALVEGETLTIRDMLYGAMVESANDCAMGLADAVSGSQAAFVELMNAKLAELGCSNTHFTNSTGMPDPDHYTTARDMGLITRYAMSIEGFDTYFGACEWVIPPTNKNSERKFGTHHSMIVGPEGNPIFGYKYAYGGKLGWTEEALHTMVTAAKNDEMDLICVVLKSKQKYAKYNDSIKLLDYCFDNFRATEIPVSVQKKDVLLYDGEEEYGKMTVYPMASVRVLTTGDIGEKDIKATASIPDSCNLSEISDISVRIDFTSRSSEMETEGFRIIPRNYIVRNSEIKDDSDALSGNDRATYKWWLFIVVPLGVLAGLALLVLVIRAYNIRKYSKLKKHRHYERLKRQ